MSTTVPGGEVAELQATVTELISTTTTTITAAPQPFEEEPPAGIEEWTPAYVQSVLGDVCGNATGIEDWTPRFWLLCDIRYGGMGAGDMWGFNAECVGDFLPGPDALSCIRDELVHYFISDYETWLLTGDPSGTWLLAAAEADLRERCIQVVSNDWGDDELQDACAGYLAGRVHAADASDDALAGDAVGFGPAAGDRLVVAAVESDDVLNVRDEPMGSVVAMLEIIRGETEDRLRVMGADSLVAAYLEENDTVVATGRARSLPGSTWYEVTVGGYTGWASAAYLAYPTTSEDVTDAVTGATGGLPQAANMDELARIVLDALGPHISGEPVTVSGPGWFEGLAEMEIDLVVRGSRHFGQRLHLAADASIDWDDTFEIIDARLRSATLQTLCSRGWNGERCL